MERMHFQSVRVEGFRVYRVFQIQYPTAAYKNPCEKLPQVRENLTQVHTYKSYPNTLQHASKTPRLRLH